MAVARSYVSREDIEDGEDLLDRISAMLHRLGASR
jgi:hypothetical protein